jgi:hypothetical protein
MDPRYPPQSFAVKGAERAGQQMSREPAHGALDPRYDADTGELAAKALGVEPCLVTPAARSGPS